LGYGFPWNIFAELSFKASPLVFCNDVDEHLFRDLEFNGVLRGGIYIEPALQVSFSFNNWLAISWDISWKYISGTKGKAHKRSPIGTGAYQNAGESGAGLSIITTGLCVNIRL
jgi:outer membrane protease